MNTEIGRKIKEETAKLIPHGSKLNQPQKDNVECKGTLETL